MKIHGKEITTIISDLDGTLLGQGQSVPEDIFELIDQFKKRGVGFVAASGRQYKNMRLLFEPIAHEIPFICENGSMVIKNDRTLYEKNIPRELCFELLGDIRSVDGAETIVSSKRELYTLASRTSFVERLRQTSRTGIHTVEDYRRIAGDFNKISIWWKEGIPEKEEKWFHERYDDRLQIADAGNGWLDFTMQEVNKGTALLEIAKTENIDLSKALCFGDSENDIAMFRACAVSYAMDTGREHVKAAADHICSNVDEELRGFLLGDRAREARLP